MDEPLIDVDELAALVDRPPQDRSPEDRPGLVLADVRWQLGGPAGGPEFEAGHLPGARYVDLESELSAEPGSDGGRHPLPEPDVFVAAMRRLGVDPDSLVVVYDDARSLAAARLWWLLTDFGHSRVRVLDGGLRAWTAAGHPLRNGPAEPAAPGRFDGRPGHRSSVDATAVTALIEEPAEGSTAPAVVDVRAYDRFTGASEPMDPVAGHIPTAISAPSMANLDDRGRFLPPEQIRARYETVDTAGVEPVFYCGSGITAAHTLLARESAGLSRGRIYPGSWSNWIGDSSRPVATGDGEQL